MQCKDQKFFFNFKLSYVTNFLSKNEAVKLLNVPIAFGIEAACNAAAFT